MSKSPFSLNQEACSQLKPSPNVLSGAKTYQWHAVSGISTAHLDQSFPVCGT